MSLIDLLRSLFCGAQVSGFQFTYPLHTYPPVIQLGGCEEGIWLTPSPARRNEKVKRNINITCDDAFGFCLGRGPEKLIPLFVVYDINSMVQRSVWGLYVFYFSCADWIDDLFVRTVEYYVSYTYMCDTKACEDKF